MLNVLLESRAKRQRSAWGAATSVVLHGGVVALAVAATMKVSAAAPPPSVPKEIIYIAPQTPLPPAVRTPQLPGAPAAPTPPRPLVDLPSLAIDHIPTEVPAPGSQITEQQLAALRSGLRPGDAVGPAIGGGREGGVPGAGGATYDLQTVDKAVVSLANNPTPRYPEMLRQAGLHGKVLAQFVVDTLGRVDLGTFRALSSDHDLFTAAVRAALQQMRFLPAQVRDTKVKQLVQMPFEFTIAR